jgi:hypothetical protein
MRRLCSIILGVIVVFLAVDPTVGGEGTVRPTGTFTSLRIHKEGGDLLGEELRVVLTRKGYQGVLQIAEGGPSILMVVEIRIEKDKIAFEIPASYPDYGGGKFEGKLDAKGITGVLRFGKAEDQVRWIRGRSYWDR